MYEVVGYRPDEVPPTGAWWWEQTHPDDRETNKKRSLNLVGDSVATEYRVRHRDGRWLRVEDRAVLLWGDDGKPVKMVGCTVDITERKEAEERLRYSEQLHRVAFEQSPTGMVYLGLDGRLIKVNPAMCEVTGYPAEELVGITVSDLTHLDDRAQNAELLAPFLRGDTPTYENDTRYVRKDGGVRWVSVTARMVTDAEGRPLHSVGVVRDITINKAAERTLRESEERFSALANAAPAMLWVTRPDATLEFISRGWHDYTGQTEAEAFGGDGFGWLQTIHPDDRERAGKVFLDANQKHESFSLDYRIRRADGEYRWAIDAGRPRTDAEGQFAGYVGSVIDVHDRKQAEGKLRASEHRLRLSLEAAATGLWDWDVTTNVVTWSPECYLIHGLKKGEFDGTAAGFDRLVHPDDRSQLWTAVRAAVDGRTKYEWEFRIVRPDGEVRWVANIGRATYDDGRPTSMVGTLTDVTDRKLAQAERESEQKTLATVVERCPFGIYIVDDEFRMVHVNTASEDGAFVNVRPLIGRPFDEVMQIIWPEPVAADCINIFRHTLATGEPYRSKDFVNLRADTRQTEGYEWEVHRVTLPSGRQGVVCYFFDATKLRQAEAEVRDGEQRMRLATEATSVGIWQWNVVTGVIRWDAQMFRIYGVSPTPDGLVQYDTWSGAVLPEDLPRQEEVLQETVRCHGSSRREFRIRRASDGDCRIVQSVETTRTSADGQVEWVLGTNLDITDRRQAEDELRRLAAELSESDRRKDVFLATLAHELRNPLAPLCNGLQVIKLAGANGTVEQARAMMDRQLLQLVRLVDDLLDVSRVTSGKLELRKERVELRAVIDAALETSRPVVEQADHELAVVVSDEPIFVDGDATRLAQVVSNLLNNSAKYTHRGGHIRLTAGRDGGAAVVSVKDDGIGIPPAMLGRVFEMFTQLDRTLEKATGGLGIGLSLVKGLLEMHGGTIEAKSDGEGLGSEFVVRLPVVMPVVAVPDRPDEHTSEVVPPGLRILVVDDNVDSADSFGQLLEMLGNEVRTANDGEAGLEVAAQFRPDVVLMDIGMPKLNGYEAARRIREHPWGGGTVLVALTGWGQEEDRKRSTDAGFNHHLVKPVETDALMKLLAGVKKATGSIAPSPTVGAGRDP